MKKSRAELRGELVAKYSEAVDEVLAETETKEDFKELEAAVERLATVRLAIPLVQGSLKELTNLFCHWCTHETWRDALVT
jgi:DNA-binding MurR/RpiR family transcriptional regulator